MRASRENLQFLANKSLDLRKRYEIGPRLLYFTNSESFTGF